MPPGLTTKYGIAVPSSEVAKYCSTVRLSASKKLGAVLICSRGPLPVPRNRREGLSNPLESRKNSSPVSSTATTTLLVAAGMPGNGSRSQLPGVTISTRLATSASVTSSRRSRVHAYWCRQVCSSGSKITRNSLAPLMNSS